MQQGLAYDWGIIGAGARTYDDKMRDKLIEQDCLTTLIELDPSAISAEIVGSMIDYLPIEAGNAPLIRKMSDPAIRIVSLTITEGGYFLDANTGVFEIYHNDIRHDAQFPQTPRSVFGAIVAALKQRREIGVGDLAPVSHENYRQLVIEDDFCAGRPALEEAGVTITPHVHMYEAMKLRILNGGHQLLAHVGKASWFPDTHCSRCIKITPFCERSGAGRSVLGANVRRHSGRRNRDFSERSDMG